MTDDLQVLISAYLNGDLADADAETLRRLLASDPKALTEFVRAIDLHGELRKVFHEGKGSVEALKEIRQAKRSRVRMIVGSVAACAAVVFLSWFFTAGSKSIARLEAVAGQVRLIDGTEVAAGQEILAGQGLETLGTGRVTVKYPDGTSLDLGPRTKVQEFAPGGENRVVLSRGSLVAEVARQPADRPMVFTTPHGEAKVLGTSLKLAVEPDLEKGSTRLEVTQGRVQLTRRIVGDSAEVAAGHFAVVAKGRAPETQVLAAERVRRMAPNSWLSLPATALRQAVPVPKAKGDPRGIVESWSGGVLDTRRNRLVVWGGGIVNYHGNEVYAFDLESLQWERLTDPTPDSIPGRQVNSDGTPIARATYNGLAYVSHADRMFALGGDSAGSLVIPDLTWTFDFAANTWQNRNPSGDLPLTWVGATCAYDPVTRMIWWGEGRSPGNAGFYSYDFDSNRWKKHSRDFFYYQTSAVDARRGVLVCLGDGKLFAYDVRGGDPVRQVWQTTGGDAFIARNNPGWDYDAVADRLVGWAGGSVFTLNPETRVWKSYDAPGAPKPTPNGIYGRWRYVPSLNVFVVVTAIDENVHLYKSPAGE